MKTTLLCPLSSVGTAGGFAGAGIGGSGGSVGIWSDIPLDPSEADEVVAPLSADAAELVPEAAALARRFTVEVRPGRSGIWPSRLRMPAKPPVKAVASGALPAEPVSPWIGEPISDCSGDPDNPPVSPPRAKFRKLLMSSFCDARLR